MSWSALLSPTPFGPFRRGLSVVQDVNDRSAASDPQATTDPVVVGQNSNTTVLESPILPGQDIALPGGFAISGADYDRSGPDLVLTAQDGASLVIHDYFAAEVPADLTTEGGGLIYGQWVERLAGPQAPGQVAQAGAASPIGDLTPIGQVETVEGAVTATRSDGTTVTLAQGDPVFQNDVIQTGDGAAVGLIFADDSTFSLTDQGRMILDEFVYDPATGEGSAGFDVVEGVFGFASGLIAKSGPDSSVITTPVATIGIRGTTGVGESRPEGTENRIGLVRDDDGGLGEIVVINDVVSTTINSENQFKTLSGRFDSGQVFELTQDQVQASFGRNLGALPDPATVTYNFDRSVPDNDNSGDNEGTNEATPEGEGEGEEEATPAEAGDGTPAEEAAPDEGAAEEALPQDGTEDLVPAETIQSDAVPDPIASNPFETFFANAFPPPPAAERQVLEILGIDPDAEDDVVVDLEDAIDEVIERIEENEERIEENRDITEERLEEPEEVEAVEGPASSPNQANNPNVEATEQQESGFQDGDFPFSEGDDVFLASDEDNTYFFNQAYGGNDFVQDLGGEDTFAFLNLSSVAVWLARTEQGYEVRFFTEGLGTGTFDTNVISAAAGFEQSFLEVLGLIEILRATTQDSFAGDNTALLTALDFAEESFAFLLAGTDAENTFVLNTDNAQGYAVFGLAGDDIIEVIEGGGAHIVGGDGTDRVDYSALSGSWRLQISYDAGLGAFQVMRQLLSGGQVIEEFNDDLFEIEGISASAGNDQIDITNGGALNSVRGLAGDDQIRVRDGGFVAEVLGNAGSDTLTIEGAFATSVEGGADSDVINILNASVDTVDGGNAGDTITVDAGTASTVTGGDGADTITVNNGSVTNLSGGAGSDSITIENSTVNNVAGGNGSDSITIVNAFVETVEGGSGNDTISVNAGNNNALTLFGGAGNDVFDIGSSAATGNIFGGDGSDKVFLRAGSIVNGTIDLDETLGDQDTLVLLNPSQTTIAGGINGVELVYYYGTTGMDDLSVNSPGIAGVTDITTRFALLPNGGSDDIDLGTTDTKFFEVVFTNQDLSANNIVNVTNYLSALDQLVFDSQLTGGRTGVTTAFQSNTITEGVVLNNSFNTGDTPDLASNVAALFGDDTYDVGASAILVAQYSNQLQGSTVVWHWTDSDGSGSVTSGDSFDNIGEISSVSGIGPALTTSDLEVRDVQAEVTPPN